GDRQQCAGRPCARPAPQAVGGFHPQRARRRLLRAPGVKPPPAGSPHRSSLRKRLVMALLAILLVAGACASLGLYWLGMRQQGEIFDERLRVLSFNLPVTALLQMPRGANDNSADGIVVQV